ncbi:zinc ribbon domain-containing protein [Simkania sp.]|uniref:zinc ribbon domain-containing protein n=1 Tax=Simkania sp. TaxID=34094 RepID=UPI003B528F0A
MLLNILSWIAIVLLSVSYWFQIWKIHVHKEVRDISLTYNILLAIGFGTLTFTAIREGSLFFLVKQIMTTIPVIIIIAQVIYHKNDRWHDRSLTQCSKCKEELETKWNFCANCGEKKTARAKIRRIS